MCIKRTWYMLKINAIKIEIVTPDGLYGFEQNFQMGLNIVRGNNSSGKSSLFQAILMQVSLKDGGNHPNLLMFDEPKQQDMSEDGFRTFLKKLSDFNSEQVLVFASFENKEESFYSATDGLSYNLICIEDKLIKTIA